LARDWVFELSRDLGGKEMSKMAVIVNPVAGRGAGARLAERIASLLREYDLDFELVATAGPGHATVLACEAVKRGSEAVVAVGGDGTVNEVLNGLVQASDGRNGAALGVLPIGTGNDFAYGAGLLLDLARACQVIARGESRLLDMGRARADGADPRYFGNGVGIGFDAIVNIESRKLKRLRGFLVYLVAVLKTLIVYYNAPRTRIQVDGELIHQPTLMVSVMNGRRLGGGFQVTPGASMDDSLFDLCIAEQINRLRMLGFVPQFIRGTHIGDWHITMRRARQVTVASDSPWAAHVDGEIYGVGACRYEMVLLPGSLRLLC
jgi:diacylglycerol kinase (ATP)